MLKKIFYLFYRNSFETLTVRSGKWKTTRKKHLEIQSCCQVCGTKKQLVVHHKIPVSIDSTKENNLENLITLCDYNNCHFLFGHLCDWSNYNQTIFEDAKNWSDRIKNEKPKNLEGSPQSFQSADCRKDL
jgi:hypothetical protein